jgi:hypothetical protein
MKKELYLHDDATFTVCCVWNLAEYKELEFKGFELAGICG